MSGTLVDSNVLLDILIPDPVWETWSSQALAEAAESSVLTINPIVFAEVSIGFERVEDLDEALPDSLRREDLPWDAASSRARHSCSTAVALVKSVLLSRISLSVHTLRCAATNC